MAKIEIISSKPAKIYINDEDHGLVSVETKEYELEAGEYEIYAKSAWCGSQKTKVNLSANEVIAFTLNSFQHENLIRVVFMIFVMLFMATKSFVFVIIGGLVFLYPLYFISVGSDKYLELVRQEE